MATGVLASVVIQRLEYLYMQEMNATWCSRDDIMKLTDSFRSIQSVMNHDSRFIWEDIFIEMSSIKDIVYDMDDVLDEWITEIQIKSQLEELKMPAAAANSSKMMKKKKKKKEEVFSFLASLCCFSSSSIRGILRNDNNIGSRIREIKERLERFNDFLEMMRNDDIEDQLEPLKSTSDHDLINISDHVYGRAIDKEIIMSRLLGDSSSSSSRSADLSHPIMNIVLIVGMGGIGKTTLAALVFNDFEVKKHFEMTMWVCVSENFDPCRIALEIIQQVGRRSAPPAYYYESNDDLYHCLSQSVEKKRFLLVLDDVMCEDPDKWVRLKLALNSGAQGSRILVTTRNEGVADVMKTTYIHYLETLSDNDCWSLISRIVFVGREKEEQEYLIEIGLKIAEKCKGLPLAAKTLGGLLRFKRTITDWEIVEKSMFWELEEFENSLMPALLLSYCDLSSPLKGCFAYCSIFPKGHEMNKDVLIKLWMAQGFINSTRGREDLEMIGEECFNHLVLRSFFQDLSKDENGNIISCKMHHSLHDFAQRILEDETFYIPRNYFMQISNHADRVDSSSFLASVYNAKRLRTFQLLTNELNPPPLMRDVPSDFFYNLKCLRVLCFSKIGLESLSNEIGKLIHLRYLDLSGNYKLRELPESMANLYNLQTLELKGCQGLSKLPKEMCRMINLRHLNIENTPSLSYLPQGFGKLSSLRTLSRFIVSEAAKGCAIEELKDLIHLKGKIKIEGLDRVKTIEEASKAELKNKNLWGLILDFKCNNIGGTVMADRMEGILDGLQPHPNSKELEIRFYLGSKLPRWIVGGPTLYDLNSLVLQDCINCTELPALGELPSLETLIIHRLQNLKHISLQFYSSDGRRAKAFPKLKHLEICDMKSLEEWDLGDGEGVGEINIMPCLRYLKLSCQKLQAFPALWKLPSLETLEIGTTGDVKHIGVEFHGNYGICGGRVAFPKLKELCISDSNLEVWDLGDGVVRQIMPCLRHVELDCPKIKVLPALGELQSLEILGITAEEMKKIGSEFYRNGCDDEHAATRVAFPNLKELYFHSMKSLEEWDLGDGEIMPLLHQLKLNCPNLKAWPALERLPQLEVLDIVLDEEETHIGCEFYGLSTGERFHSWYEKIGGMGLWRIRRKRNH